MNTRRRRKTQTCWHEWERLHVQLAHILCMWRIIRECKRRLRLRICRNEVWNFVYIIHVWMYHCLVTILLLIHILNTIMLLIDRHIFKLQFKRHNRFSLELNVFCDVCGGNIWISNSNNKVFEQTIYLVLFLYATLWQQDILIKFQILNFVQNFEILTKIEFLINVK